MDLKIDKVVEYVKFQSKYFGVSLKESWDSYVNDEVKGAFVFQDVLDYIQLEKYCAIDIEARDFDKKVKDKEIDVNKKLLEAQRLIINQKNFIKEIYETNKLGELSPYERKKLVRSVKDKM